MTFLRPHSIDFNIVNVLRPHPKYWNIVLCISCLILVAAGCNSAANAQDGQQELRFNNKVLPCDESVSLQDVAVANAVQTLNKEAVLFVVIKPGTGEGGEELARRRIWNVQQYFRNRGSRLEKERILIALGPPVDGNGRLEFYINGELFLRLVYPKKGFICHSCCGPDPAYYPYKKGKQ